MSYNRRRRGFTLVELLVVTEVIAVLICLLLPVLSGARQRAYAVGCTANLRWIGQALGQYVKETRYYPGNRYSRSDGAARIEYIVWAPRLRRAMVWGKPEDRHIFRCPARPAEWDWPMEGTGLPAWWGRAKPDDAGFGYTPGEPPLMNSTFPWPTDWSGSIGHWSYGYNAIGVAPGWVTFVPRGLGDNSATTPMLQANLVKVPDQTIAVADSWDSGGVSIVPAAWSTPKPIHWGGSNVLFCDGHVQWYAQADLMIPETAGINDPTYLRIAPMWNFDHKP